MQKARQVSKNTQGNVFVLAWPDCFEICSVNICEQSLSRSCFEGRRHRQFVASLLRCFCPLTFANEAFLVAVLSGSPTSAFEELLVWVFPASNCKQSLPCTCFEGRRHRRFVASLFWISSHQQLRAAPFLQLLSRAPSSHLFTSLFLCLADDNYE